MGLRVEVVKPWIVILLTMMLALAGCTGVLPTDGDRDGDTPSATFHVTYCDVDGDRMVMMLDSGGPLDPSNIRVTFETAEGEKLATSFVTLPSGAATWAVKEEAVAAPNDLNLREGQSYLLRLASAESGARIDSETYRCSPSTQQEEKPPSASFQITNCDTNRDTFTVKLISSDRTLDQEKMSVVVEAASDGSFVGGDDPLGTGDWSVGTSVTLGGDGWDSRPQLSSGTEYTLDLRWDPTAETISSPTYQC